MDLSKYRITQAKGNHLRDHETDDAAGLRKGKEADALLAANIERLRERQEVLFAHNKYGVLLILQAMDAAGKDGVIKHVMSGLNPQGVQVKSFKVPTADEIDHDYLWRAQTHLPARGNIAIFNRSYYEDVVVVRLHDLLAAQNMPVEFQMEPYGRTGTGRFETMSGIWWRTASWSSRFSCIYPRKSSASGC
jgi:polyphosphate kinase 2 (PPK2 family)